MTGRAVLDRTTVAAAIFALPLAGPAYAATTTANMNVQMTITASCVINSASTLNFGSNGVLTANVDQTSTISVSCTNTTPYNIGLNAGTGTGATVAVRKLTSGGSTIDYTLYRDSGRTAVWGNTVPTDTMTATGNGAAQTFTVYGRVPPQTTPAPAAYSDTITVTVTY